MNLAGIISVNSITTFKKILVNKLSTSRLAMKWSGQKLETLPVNIMYQKEVTR